MKPQLREDLLVGVRAALTVTKPNLVSLVDQILQAPPSVKGGRQIGQSIHDSYSIILTKTEGEQIMAALDELEKALPLDTAFNGRQVNFLAHSWRSMMSELAGDQDATKD